MEIEGLREEAKQAKAGHPVLVPRATLDSIIQWTESLNGELDAAETALLSINKIVHDVIRRVT
jgi:hypothetical protein